MAQVSYPGVYIQEVPSGVRTITSVATSITAFIDFFREGPMGRAVEVFGMTDFEREFGGLDDRSEASYALSQYFLNGGGTALVIRAASGSPAKASAGIKSTTGAGTALLTVSAANEGIWGNNLRVDLDLNTTDPTKFFNLAVTRYDGSVGKSRPLAVERYLNLSVNKAHPRYVEAVVNDASKLIRVKHETPADTTTLPLLNGTGSTADIGPLTQAQLDALSAKQIHVKIGTGSAAETERAVTLGPWTAGTVKTLRDLRGRLEKAIQSVNVSGLKSPASWAGATVELVGENRFRVLSGKGGETYSPSELVVISNEAADTTATAVLKFAAVAPDSNNVQQYALGSGAAGNAAALIAGTAGTDGAAPGATELVAALSALDTVDLFNILCIPRTTKMTSDTELTTAVSKAIKYCEDHRAFFILDFPESINETQEIRDWLDAHTFRSKNAAVYFPLPRIPDPKNEFRLRSVAASGTLAGVYARTDSARGVWKAPAGIEAQLNGVSEFDLKLTDAHNGVLNPLGINCLRTFPIYGNIAWGARTLEGADQMGSEWKYIPIRRLTLMLEESLFRGTKWVVFEPNDEPLWAKIRLNVGAYMMSLFREGAFQGTNPKDAFFVKCDAETTTQDDRNKGIVNILVGFAPLKPAEFVVISIQQIAGDL